MNEEKEKIEKIIKLIETEKDPYTEHIHIIPEDWEKLKRKIRKVK